MRSPKLDLQLKCTASGPVAASHLDFPISIKNYDDLRDSRVMVPRLLVVVVIPKLADQWLLHDETKLSLHHCAYWLSLRGMTDKTGQATVTVKVPRNQCFDVPNVTSIMTAIAGGGLP